jgi:hypothetical protein
MICNHCGKPVVLVPSAAERARKFGSSPRDYERLFPVHADCALRERSLETLRLINREALALVNAMR